MKSYFAATVQAAMLRARQELGSDALLIHSRPTTGNARQLGEYEVVFALGPKLPSPAGNNPPAAPAETAPSQPSPAAQDAERLRSEVAAMKREMARLAAAIGRPNWTEPERAPQWGHPEFELVQNEFLDQEIDRDWLQELLHSADRSARPEWPVARVRQHIERELERQITVNPTLGIGWQERQVIALVGPPGAGKTTSLVKLATRYGLTARRSAHIISTDVERVAAAEQLRAYAAILGMGFQLVDSPQALSQALEECRQKQFVFIDTPGYGEEETITLREMATCLTSRLDIDTHLVLPAPFRAKDLRRVVDRFSAFSPGKLLITRLDETETIGPLLNESRRMKLPFSYLSSGQQIPEDLTPATAEFLLSRLTGRLPRKVTAA